MKEKPEYIQLLLRQDKNHASQIHVLIGHNASNSTEITEGFHYRQYPVFDFYNELLEKNIKFDDILKKYVRDLKSRKTITDVFKKGNLLDSDGYAISFFKDAIKQFKGKYRVD